MVPHAHRRWTLVHRTLGLLFFSTSFGSPRVTFACDIWAVYTATEQSESRRGLRVGAASQYTHFGTLLRDGREVPNTAGESVDHHAVGRGLPPEPQDRASTQSADDSPSIRPPRRRTPRARRSFRTGRPYTARSCLGPQHRHRVVDLRSGPKATSHTGSRTISHGQAGLVRTCCSNTDIPSRYRRR